MRAQFLTGSYSMLLYMYFKCVLVRFIIIFNYSRTQI